MADGRLDIESRIDFFARVEDIIRIEEGFYLGKEVEHCFAKHLIEVGGADYAVVVFAADRTTAVNGCFEEFFRHFHNQGGGGFVSEIKQGIEMEVAIASVAVDSGLDVEFFEQAFDAGEEFG